MSKASTKAKLKYNRGAYRRYEFNLSVDSKLNSLVERYKSDPDNNLSKLIKTLLCSYFGIEAGEADDIFAEYYISKDEVTVNTGLDKYLSWFPDAGPFPVKST